MRYLIIIIFLSGFHVLRGQSAHESPEQVTINLEKKLLEAYTNRDEPFLNSIFDESYVGVLPTGHKVNKAGIVKHIASSSPYVLLTFEDIKSRVIDNVAVTSGIMVSKSKSGSLIGQTRFLRVYQHKNGTWKIIEGQETVVIGH